MQIAILTGASAGLGRSFFRAILRDYPDLDAIWLVARRAERLEEMAKDSLVPVVAIPLDLTETAAYEALNARLAAENPRVKILINNAGVGSLGDLADSDWPTQTRMVDLNCRGVTAVTTVVAPHMEPGGFMIQVASIASFVPNVRMTVYSATKAFVKSFSRSLRLEMKKRKVNVLAVCPGPMATEFLDVANISGNSKTFDRLPYSDPNKVAKTALRRAAAGKGMYTPLLFFKFYRVLAKLLPQAWLMPLAKT